MYIWRAASTNGDPLKKSCSGEVSISTAIMSWAALWETQYMPRPSLINLVRVRGIIAQGDCPIGSSPRYSTPLIAQMSPPCGLKRSNITHLPSGDQTG